MSDITLQESLFEDPMGMRFRHSRERRGWTQEDVGQRLKLPVAIIDAVEREDWTRLGAPVYVRSYVGSYARLMELPAELVDEIVAGKQPPPLVVVADTSGTRRMLDRGMLKLAYLVLTVGILGSAGMLLMHFQGPARIAKLLPLDPPISSPSTPFAAKSGRTDTRKSAGASSAEVAPSAAMMASLAPSLPSAVEDGTLVFHFDGPSWLEVVDRQGQRIERGLVPQGSERRFSPAQVSRITFGNAGAVEVSQGGRALDLSSYREAEVVRFAVSSQGRVSSPGN